MQAERVSRDARNGNTKRPAALGARRPLFA